HEEGAPAERRPAQVAGGALQGPRRIRERGRKGGPQAAEGRLPDRAGCAVLHRRSAGERRAQVIGEPTRRDRHQKRMTSAAQETTETAAPLRSWPRPGRLHISPAGPHLRRFAPEWFLVQTRRSGIFVGGRWHRWAC